MHEFQIVGGANGLELMAQLQDVARELGDNRPTFTLRLHLDELGEHDIPVWIHGLVSASAEYDWTTNGQQWIIRGRISDAVIRAFPMLKPLQRFQGVYDARRRQGSIAPIVGELL